jgi:hypothetical protein
MKTSLSSPYGTVVYKPVRSSIQTAAARAITHALRHNRKEREALISKNLRRAQ